MTSVSTARLESDLEEALRRIEVEAKEKTGRLDLSGLLLKRLPQELRRVAHLAELSCGAKNLDWVIRVEERPLISDLDALVHLPKLRDFSCNGAVLADLVGLSNCPELQRLNCSHTNITSFTGISACTKLERLKCANTPIEYLHGLGNCSSLKFLDCRATKLVDLTGLTNCSSLEVLDCGSTQIKNLDGLKACTNLQSLNCSSTQIKNLDELKACTNLQSLDCSSTQIKNLDELKACTNLQSLDCSNTQIKNLDGLKACTILQSLDCRNTQIKSLDGLKACTDLQSLICYNTPISSLDGLEACSNLTSLDCYNTSIRSLEGLRACPSLQTLNCSNNQITSLAGLENCSDLKNLDCFMTKIRSLEGLETCYNLQNLDCHKTEITSLDSLKACGNLLSLDCSNTLIKGLEGLKTSAALISLKCHNNKITNLSGVESCSALQSLDCSNTQITNLKSLESCSALQSLNCSHVAIQICPGIVWSLGLLKDVIAVDASICGVPSDILSLDFGDNCLPRIRDFLSALAENSEPLTATNLFLLGNGSAGKTSITKALRGQPVARNWDSTHGICFVDILLPNEDEPSCTLHGWDFGGQDLYHGAHSLFLNGDAIFVICWTHELETGETEDQFGHISINRPVDYWLSYAQAHGGEKASYLILETKCDDGRAQPCQDDIADPRQEFSAIQHLRIGNLREEDGAPARRPRGLAGLKAWLEDEALAILDQHPVTEMPSSWLGVREKLRVERATNRVIDRDRFESLAKEAGLKVGYETVLFWLNATSEVIWRKGYFDDQIILDVNWALEAIYALFDRETSGKFLVASKGRFEAADLDLVWSNPKFMPGDAAIGKQDQKLLLDFMLQAGMCFEHGGYSYGEKRPRGYIAPYYLPETIPAGAERAWDEDSASQSIRLPIDMLHDGLWRPVMSRLGSFAGNNGYYWQDGLQFVERRGGFRVRVLREHGAGYAGALCVKLQATRQVAEAKAGETLSRISLAIFEALQRQRADLHWEDETREVVELERLETETASITPQADPEEVNNWYVSYAWADDSDPDREADVERLMEEAKARNQHLHIDKTAMKPGDSIREYIEKLSKGRRIFVFISQKYVESEYCMAELVGIWNACDQDVVKFLDTVRVYVLDSAQIYGAENLQARKRYWRDRYQDFHAEALANDPNYFNKKHSYEARMSADFYEFWQEADTILSEIADRLQRPNFEELKESGFQP